jgi:hypothetical protein
MGERLQTRGIAEAVGEGLPCLKCGYDLRANAGDRCSECGWEIDRELLKGGWFPWERRRYRGRFVSYVKTVWQVSVGSKRLADAAGRAHGLADGRAFARVTGAIVAIVVVGLFFLIMRDEGMRWLAFEPKPTWPPQPPWPVWVENLAVPWSAGATLLAVGPLLLAAFAFFAARAPRRLFAAKNPDSAVAESSEAIACYATAPMAWLLPVGVVIAGLRGADGVAVEGFMVVGLSIAAVVVGLFGIVVRVRHAVKRTKPNIWFMPAMLLAGVLIYLILFGLSELGWALRDRWKVILGVAAACVALLTMIRIVQWGARVRHWGAARALLAVPHLLGIWLVGGVFLFGVLPWVIGFIWIVVDSFR